MTRNSNWVMWRFSNYGIGQVESYANLHLVAEFCYINMVLLCPFMQFQANMSNNIRFSVTSWLVSLNSHQFYVFSAVKK